MAGLTRLFLFACLTSTSFVSSAQTPALFSSSTDCTVAGCFCRTGFCADFDLFRLSVEHCPDCASNTECTANAEDECRSEFRKCSECVTRRGLSAHTKCNPDSSTTSPACTNTPNPQLPTNGCSRIKECTLQSECLGVGCSCAEGQCVDVRLLTRNIRQCRACVSDADCFSAGNECRTHVSKWKYCATSAALPAYQKCNGGNTSPPTSPDSKPGTTQPG